MRNSEREKLTPREYITQLAKDTVGIGAGRRFRKRHENELDIMPKPVLTLGQILAPITMEESEKGIDHTIFHTKKSMIITLLLEAGIDSAAIFLALAGHIGEGATAKILYNAGVNAFLEKIDSSLGKSSTPPAGTK